MAMKPLPQAKISIVEPKIFVLKFLDKDGNYYPFWIGDTQTGESIKGAPNPQEIQVKSKNNDDPIHFIMDNFYEIDTDEMDPDQKYLYGKYPETTKKAMLKRGYLFLQNCDVSLEPGGTSSKADIIITRREPGLFDIEINEK